MQITVKPFACSSHYCIELIIAEAIFHTKVLHQQFIRIGLKEIVLSELILTNKAVA